MELRVADFHPNLQQIVKEEPQAMEMFDFGEAVAAVFGKPMQPVFEAPSVETAVVGLGAIRGKRVQFIVSDEVACLAKTKKAIPVSSPFTSRIAELKGRSKVDIIHDNVARQYSKARSSTADNWSSDERRIDTAKQLGLTPIGRPSAFAELVATHPELPDVVLKVVDANDGGARYAKAVYNKEIDSIHAPVIHAYHEVEGKAFIYMERLIDMKDMKEDVSHRMDVTNEFVRYNMITSHRIRARAIHTEDEFMELEHFQEQLHRWKNSDENQHILGFDMHSGNAMFRADGTWVSIDPVYNC